jgi:hypothetical protein
MGLSYPFFSWLNTQVYPGVGRRDYREVHIANRTDNKAKSGKKSSTYFGKNRVISVTLPDISSTVRDNLVTFYEAVRDGTEFTYHDDDSYYKCGDASLDSGDITCGALQNTGATDRKIRCTIEGAQFEPIEHPDVWNIWDVTFTMQEVE